jgi:peptidoglycan/xylan/chitin deacetylase (PgdA/CDA1 family)/flagellar hook assembly protein FlgD
MARPLGPAPAQPALDVAPVVSPNGDGVKDFAAISIELPVAVTLTVTVLTSDGSPVVDLATAVTAGPSHVGLRWDGRTAGGSRAPDGGYLVRAQTVDAQGVTTDTSAPVRVDTRAPALGWVAFRSEPGSGPLATTYRVQDASPEATVTLELVDRSGRIWLSGRHGASSGVHRDTWPLRDPSGHKLGPGAYRARLIGTDDAGNSKTGRARPLLVEYPVHPRVIRRVDGAGARMALTFDDCNDGDAWTSILQTLERRHLQASFFCIGSQVSRHAAQARRALRDGDTIGNHTWAHAFLPARSYSEVASEVERTTRAWWQLARVAPMPYFRPPYGALSSTALAAIGSRGYRTVVLWDVDPQDWRRPGVGAIVDRAAGPAHGGSIVLLHVLPETAAALPGIVTRLQAKGLHPVSLDRLLGRV